MALKRLKVKMAAAPASKADKIPTLLIDGSLVKQYNQASEQMKRAEEVMADLKPEILEAGVGEIFRLSTEDPKNPVPTVKVQDEEGEVLRVQFTCKYGKIADVDAAEELFESLTDPDGKPVDINAWVQETVAATFNCKVFNDVDGKFQQKIYDKFRIAIQKVATDLGVECPLETQKVVVPLPAFHENRWAMFPDPSVQQQLSQVCPNTIQVVPVTVKATVGK